MSRGRAALWSVFKAYHEIPKIEIQFLVKNCRSESKFTFAKITEMLAELSRREKTSNIMPDPDLDIYMKVRKYSLEQKFTTYSYNKFQIT